MTSRYGFTDPENQARLADLERQRSIEQTQQQQQQVEWERRQQENAQTYDKTAEIISDLQHNSGVSVRSYEPIYQVGHERQTLGWGHTKIGDVGHPLVAVRVYVRASNMDNPNVERMRAVLERETGKQVEIIPYVSPAPSSSSSSSSSDRYDPIAEGLIPPY